MEDVSHMQVGVGALYPCVASGGTRASAPPARPDSSLPPRFRNVARRQESSAGWWCRPRLFHDQASDGGRAAYLVSDLVHGRYTETVETRGGFLSVVCGVSRWR